MRRRYALVVAGGALVCLAGLGAAQVAQGDERASTAALLDQLDHDTAHAPVFAENVKRARTALERATRLRAAGDETHARLADGLAREEAETARDLARAVDAEQAANDAKRGAMDAGVMGERERALLEEGIARNGRLRAQIEELGRPRAEAKTSKTAGSDAGAAPPPATGAKGATGAGAGAGAGAAGDGAPNAAATKTDGGTR